MGMGHKTRKRLTMKSIKRKIALIVTILLLVYVLHRFVYPFGIYYLVVRSYAKEANEKKIVLLYKTDHKVLLHACRELYKEGYRGEFNLDENIHPDVKKFPEIILALDPAQVLIDDDRVNIGMMRGIGGFGVFVYPKNFIEPFKGYNIGDKKLLDDLWYYDTGYKPGYEKEYEKYLQSLKPQ